ncbi:MAG: hypothetical protein KZQ83_19725 [gamma proteobacterium symbiont of Taylorina sp.]|nr:hypothetical protein [gamma proteobacterium symbiont of Taylorina sp.]
MKKTIIAIGIGEMSGVFTRALLRAGYPIFPVTRDSNISEVHQLVSDPEMILVAVGENDLNPVLEQLPQSWKDKVVLLQNELLPKDWQKFALNDPTIISVWFEKKKGQDFKVLVPSPVFGAKADIIKKALSLLEIPSFIVPDDKTMLFELVRKNLYILMTNIAGLEVGGNVNTLWNQHRELAIKVFDELLLIQNHITAHENDRERLIEAVVEAINGDLSHQCMGRSAPARLARAVEYAEKYQLQHTELERIAKQFC